jgi:hypothetical protein
MNKQSEEKIAFVRRALVEATVLTLETVVRQAKEGAKLGMTLETFAELQEKVLASLRGNGAKR